MGKDKDLQTTYIFSKFKKGKVTIQKTIDF